MPYISSSVNECMPFQFSSVKICINKYMSKPIIEKVLFSIESKNRPQFKLKSRMFSKMVFKNKECVGKGEIVL